jgi:hypothetical protein
MGDEADDHISIIQLGMYKVSSRRMLGGRLKGLLGLYPTRVRRICWV